MKNSKLKIIKTISAFCVLHFAFLISAKAQQPVPSAPKSIKLPAISEKSLKNGLTVVTAEKKSVPIVTVQFQTGTGSNGDDSGKSGTANLTANLLTKGTKTRTATQIANSIESLGGSISSGASFDSSIVKVTITSDKIEQALAILADVVLNPKFDQKEIDLLKKQTIDDLNFRLKQPGSLAGFVTSVYTFKEYPVIGNIQSVNSIDRKTIMDYYKENYKLQDSTLIFTGDITAVRANALAQKYFSKGGMPLYYGLPGSASMPAKVKKKETELVKRILVVDLPDAGQAAVTFARRFEENRAEYDKDKGSNNYSKVFFPAVVLNSVLGGGYSSRLNQEIRIKRGLSYGAGSSVIWRSVDSNFLARTQTKNESAAEVAELIVAEIKRLMSDSASENELTPRKSVVTGNFGRNLETTEGLANALGELYSYRVSADQLNGYMKNVFDVKPKQIQDFASENLMGGDIIIVGDYAKFKDDLAKRFSNMKIEIVKADKFNLSKIDYDF